jgi:Flp pilus assembly pilin Flp
MRNLAQALAAWLSLDSKRGITAIEYALIASLIAIGIIGGVTLTGTHLAGALVQTGEAGHIPRELTFCGSELGC